MAQTILGRRVREKRNELRLNQEEIANKAKISRTYLSQIEGGQASNVSVEVLGNLATALGVKTSYLMGEDDSTNLNIETPLYEYASEAKLDFADLVLLEKMAFRGSRPKTKEEWKKLHIAIKKVLDDLDK